MTAALTLRVLLAIAAASVARAEIVLPAIFSDGMVLQAGAKAPVWGTAVPGARVVLRWDGVARAHATADGAGRWRAILKDLAPGGPHVLEIETAGSTRTLRDVLAGEVWLAAGQSNMEYPLPAHLRQYQTAEAMANAPNLRIFTVPRAQSLQPRQDAAGAWSPAVPGKGPASSAVAFFFARDIQATTKVPVGVIVSAFGGTCAELWTPREVLQEVFPDAYIFITERQLLAREAAQPGVATNGFPSLPGVVYNAMIAPLTGFGIRGVIWYQGETNVQSARNYRKLFGALVRGWRARWGRGNFPFLYVQIAPYGYPNIDPSLSSELREAQLLALSDIPNSAMVVTTDVGDALDIHPPRKEPVGQRLALAARALAYGEKIEYSGPLFSGMTVQGARAILSFRHAESGLKAEGGALKGFVSCGADKVFVSSTAVIEGNRVIVTHPQGQTPLAVRYGWENVPDVNLVNQARLPASPFRTDTP